MTVLFSNLLDPKMVLQVGFYGAALIASGTCDSFRVDLVEPSGLMITASANSTESGCTPVLRVPTLTEMDNVRFF